MNSFHLSLLRKVFICVWPEGRWRIPLLPRRCRQVWNFCMSPPVTIKTKALSWACHLRLISKAAEIAGDGLIEYVDSNTPCLSLLHAHLLSCRVRGSGLSFGNREGGHNTLFQYFFFFPVTWLFLWSGPSAVWSLHKGCGPWRTWGWCWSPVQAKNSTAQDKPPLWKMDLKSKLCRISSSDHQITEK